MIALVVTTSGKLGPSAQGFFQILSDFAYSSGVRDRGLWLRISQRTCIVLVTN